MRRTPLTERLARFSARRPWLTIAAWLVIVVAAGGLLVAFGDSLQAADDFIGHPNPSRPKSCSPERIPGADADTEIVVVRSTTLTVDDPAFAARVRELAAAIRALAPRDVRGVATWYDAQAAADAAAAEARAAQAAPGTAPRPLRPPRRPPAGGRPGGGPCLRGPSHDHPAGHDGRAVGRGG